MTPRAASRLVWLPWFLAGTSLALGAAGATFGVLNGYSAIELAREVAVGVLLAVTFPLVGALIASRRPGNPLGWIFCLLAVVGLAVSPRSRSRPASPSSATGSMRSTGSSTARSSTAPSPPCWPGCTPPGRCGFPGSSTWVGRGWSWPPPPWPWPRCSVRPAAGSRRGGPRFNRARYDATRTVEVFSARLRDQVELDALRAELLSVVDQTVQPTRASLWLRDAGPSGASV